MFKTVILSYVTLEKLLIANLDLSEKIGKVVIN